MTVSKTGLTMNLFFRGSWAVRTPGCYLQDQELSPLLYLLELPLPYAPGENAECYIHDEMNYTFWNQW